MSTNWPPGTDSFSTTIAGGDSMAGVHAALHDKIAAALNALEAKTGLVKLAELSGAAANYDFTSIPSGYRALLLEVYARGDTAASESGLLLQFNADTGNNYDHQRNTIAGGVTSPGETIGTSSIYLGNMPAASAPAGLFCATRADMPGYSNTGGNKALLCANAVKIGTTSGSLFQETTNGFWRSSTAINELKLVPFAGNFASSSYAALYGVL